METIKAVCENLSKIVKNTEKMVILRLYLFRTKLIKKPKVQLIKTFATYSNPSMNGLKSTTIIAF